MIRIVTSLAIILFVFAAAASQSDTAEAKNWCLGVWKPVSASSGNFALRGGSFASAQWNVSSYSSAASGRNARKSYMAQGYGFMGPTTCKKVYAFKPWLGAQTTISLNRLRRWNSNYNCVNWGKC